MPFFQPSISATVTGAIVPAEGAASDACGASLAASVSAASAAGAASSVSESPPPQAVSVRASAQARAVRGIRSIMSCRLEL